MNKKFLLLPLTAITASVYASDEQQFIAISEESTGLNQVALNNFTGVYESLPDLYQIVEVSDGIYKLSINPDKQIEALTDILTKLKDIYKDNPDRLQITNNKTLKDEITEILKDTSYKFKAQAPTLSKDQQSDKIIITPKITEGVEYKNIDFTKPIDISMLDLYDQIGYKVKGIKNHSKFLIDTKGKTIKLNSEATTEDIDQAVAQFIQEQNIQIEQYQTDKRTLEDKYPDNEYAKMKFKFNEEGEVDKTKRKFRLFQSEMDAQTKIKAQEKQIQTANEAATDAQRQIDQLKREKQALETQLAEKDKKLKEITPAPTYNHKASQELDKIAQQLKDSQFIALNEAQAAINTIFDNAMPKIKNKLKINGQTPSTTGETPKADINDAQKQAIINDLKLNPYAIHNIIRPMKFQERQITPDALYYVSTQEFTFIRGMKNISLLNMTNLYKQLIQVKDGQTLILQEKDPTKWSPEKYKKAIDKIITKEADAKIYGIQPAPNSPLTIQKCIDDIKNFNAWQQAKFTMVYLINQAK